MSARGHLNERFIPIANLNRCFGSCEFSACDSHAR